MAVSKDFIVKEENLCCSICLELFDKPKSLPCLHSFCHVCIIGYVENVLRNKQKLHCPLCRADTKTDIGHFDNVEKWVESLPVNFMLVSILSDKKSKMSDEANDCGPCLLEGTKTHAVVQCFECSERLCEQCKKFHQRIKGLSSHKLYDISGGQTDIVKLEALKTITQCPEHQTEVVRYICKDHDQLCCNECAIIKHRKCDHMISLADELASSEITGRETSETLDEMTKELDTFIEYETKHQSSVQASVEEVGDKLVNLKKVIDEEFNKMKEILQGEIAEKSRNILKKSKTHSEEVEVLKSEVDVTRRKLNDAREHGEKMHLFLMERALKKEVKRHDELLQRLGRQSTVSNVNIVDDISEQDLVKTITSCFHIEETTSIRPTHVCQAVRELVDRKPVLVCEEKLEVSKGYVRACIWIGNNVVIAFQEMKQIQLFYAEIETLKFIEMKSTQSEPWSLRDIDNSRFAVCFPYSKTINIMEIIEGSLQTMKSFKTDKGIWDISFDRSKSEIISLSRSGAVDIYKLDGTMVRSVSFTKDIVNALEDAYSISFDICTSILYISSYGLHKLLAVKLNDETVFEYSCSKFQYPWHLDIDTNGDLWVPCYHYDRGMGVIHQIDNTGKLVREMKLSGHGLCVCFDDRKTRFLVLTKNEASESVIQMYRFK